MELWLMWIIAGFVAGHRRAHHRDVLPAGARRRRSSPARWSPDAGGNEIVQAIVGVRQWRWSARTWCTRWHVRNRASTRTAVNFLDRGQAVVLEGWVDEGARVARVKYRGSSWDARLARPPSVPSPGTHALHRIAGRQHAAWSPPRRRRLRTQQNGRQSHVLENHHRSHSRHRARRGSRTARLRPSRRSWWRMVVVFIFEGVRIVPQQNAWVVERLGKFHACSSPA